jgi:hypothetical protein
MNITGQSISYEPYSMGISGEHLTGLERYLKASGTQSKFNTLQREVKDKNESYPMATTETLQRTLANDPRKTVVSNGIMTAPLISGRATSMDNAEQRMKDNKQGLGMVSVNTALTKQNTPTIHHIM